MQRVLDHAHQDTDCLCGANQPLDWVGCIFKVNTSNLEQSMELSVMSATERRGEPNQVLTTANMVMLNIRATTTYHAYRSQELGGTLHEPPPTE